MADLSIQRGILPGLMTGFKKAAEGTDGKKDSINGTEMKRLLDGAMSAISDRYDGAVSEAGLAALRNALAKTVQAAGKNWSVSSTGSKVAREMLGPKLDGKGGKLAQLEAQIRAAVRMPTARPYAGYVSRPSSGSPGPRVSVGS